MRELKNYERDTIENKDICLTIYIIVDEKIDIAQAIRLTH